MRIALLNLLAILGLLTFLVLLGRAVTMAMPPYVQSAFLPVHPQAALIDDTHDLSAARRRFESGQGLAMERTHFGFRKEAVWLSVVLEPEAIASRPHFLVIDYANHDYVDAYVEQPGGTFRHAQAGDLRPFAVRPVAFARPTFPLPTTSKVPIRVFLRVQSEGSMQIPLVLLSDEELARYEVVLASLGASLVGGALVLFLFNMIFFFHFRESNFLSFAFYLMTFTLLTLDRHGLSSQLLWPDLPYWANRVNLALTPLALTFVLLSTTSLLNLRRHMPRLDFGFKAAAAVFALLGPLSFAFPYGRMVLINITCAQIGLVFFLVLGVYFVSRRLPHAWSWIAGFVLFFGTFFLVSGQLSGLIPRSIGSILATELFAYLHLAVFSTYLRQRFLSMRFSLARSKHIAQLAQERAARTELGAQLKEALHAQEKERMVHQAVVNRLEADRLRRVSELAKFVTHEINNPLSIIRIAAENAEFMMKRMGVNAPPQLLEQLDVIRKVCTRISGTVASVRRLVQNERTTAPQWHSLAEIIEDSLIYLRPRADAGQVRIVVEPLVGSIEVFGSGIQVGQLVIIIVNNAIEALAHQPEDKNRQVEIRAQFQEKSLALEFRNNGPQIPDDDLARLSEPFFTTKGETGLGLGLFLAQRIVMEHEARMEVSSTPEHTVFTIVFPGTRFRMGAAGTTSAA